MYELTEEQEKYITMLLNIQEKRIWNNGRKSQLRRILREKRYTDMERKYLNQMNDAYKEFCRDKIASGDPNYSIWPLTVKKVRK